MRESLIARRHNDGRILCGNRRCGFCFGAVTPEGIAYIDGGFAPNEKVREDRPYSRRINRSDREQNGPFALTSFARMKYQEAKRERAISTYRAPARSGDPDRVWPLYEDVEAVCPEHGLQTISIEVLGAKPAPYPDAEYVPWRNDPEPDQVRRRLTDL